MRRSLVPLFAAGLFLASSLAAHTAPNDLIRIEGGPFKNPHSRFYGQDVSVPGFLMAKYEVTQQQWVDLMGSNPSQFPGADRPVEGVSWYDAIEYCNRLSEREGLQPYYEIQRNRPDPENQNEEDPLKWTVTINAQANGYRLPSELEWEYAASGGQLSQGFQYSGSDDLDAVAWYWQNAGDRRLEGGWYWPMIQQNNNRTHPVGSKQPNELGLHDLSGNVREWVWDRLDELPPDLPEAAGMPGIYLRLWKGGGWLGGDFCCEPAFRAGFEPHATAADQGFRVCRNG
jgi:formylglycine-generating enzyme